MANKNWIIVIAVIVAVLLIAGFYYATRNTTPTPTVQNISFGINPPRGNASAKVTIVEFSDFQCPACGAAEPTVQSILATFRLY